MEKAAPAKRRNKIAKDKAPIDIVYYMDPLCCWSWAFEPVIRQLKEDWGEKLSLRYCMGGMLASWDTYQDGLLSVSRPIQMGPVWMQARQLCGIPLNDHIWFTDPPASSYPACVAVKSAGLQSPAAEERLLYKLREAVMLKAMNIAKKKVLLELAAELEQEAPAIFNAALFTEQLACAAAINAFKTDLEERKYRNITRFPSLLVQTPVGEKSLLITGNRSYEALLSVLEKV